MFRPHGREGGLEVSQTEEEAEEKLVAGEGFAGDDEGDGELDLEVEGQRFDG